MVPPRNGSWQLTLTPFIPSQVREDDQRAVHGGAGQAHLAEDGQSWSPVWGRKVLRSPHKGQDRNTARGCHGDVSCWGVLLTSVEGWGVLLCLCGGLGLPLLS